MTADRQTFHESWYRVAGVRPRLRTTVQTSRQHFRGRRWHVVQDPSNNRYFRLDDVAYAFVGLLDGRRTVEEAWQISNELHGDASPTQGEVISLLGQLYRGNLLQADMPADATAMFETGQRRSRRELGGKLANLLFLRIPLADPDAFLRRWERLGGAIFHPLGAVAWLLLLAAAVVAIAGRLPELMDGASDLIAPD
ncbi:MAG: PqqD family protein, partial [Planctomycetota bacterium]